MFALFWFGSFALLGWWFFGGIDAADWEGSVPRLTSACSGAQGDPPELGKLIAARGGWIQLALAGARSEQLEDHTRWTGPRQTLVFSPTVLRAGGPNKDHFWSLGVCVCVLVAPV